ncbi:hypothetical protein HYG81_17970 [Natrinema zhouii]|uniref:Uncharacterized protein n=1 Tax=Natrinema zhouii TaxID=1710539 RepID=A0A7D6CNT1_9EURY|nr:hypothetical protein [Natrinema zhouii]QLK25938.1 hypothetical protein HYG81_17970 [Natrinema zhouii]
MRQILTDESGIKLRLNLIIALSSAVLLVLLLSVLSLEIVFIGILLVGIGFPVLFLLVILLR